MRIFRERGVADLFRLQHEEPQLLRGAFIADKVVGKGAAALMVLGGVEGLFADVVSRPAAPGRAPAPWNSFAPRGDGRRVPAVDRRVHAENEGTTWIG